MTILKTTLVLALDVVVVDLSGQQWFRFKPLNRIALVMTEYTSLSQFKSASYFALHASPIAYLQARYHIQSRCYALTRVMNPGLPTAKRTF